MPIEQTKIETQNGQALYTVIKPTVVKNGTSGNDLFAQMIDHDRYRRAKRTETGETLTERPKPIQIKGAYSEDEEGASKCDWIPWGADDLLPHHLWEEVRKSGTAGTILQRLANMFAGLEISTYSETGNRDELSEVDKKALTELVSKAKADFNNWGLHWQSYQGAAQTFGEGETVEVLPDVHRQPAFRQIVHNLLLFHIAPLFVSSRRKAVTDEAEAENATDRSYWQTLSITPIAPACFRIGRPKMRFHSGRGMDNANNFAYILPKAYYTEKEDAPEVKTILSVVRDDKNKGCVAKTPLFNPNKFTVNDKGEKKPLSGKNLVECWVLKIAGVMDGRYPLALHHLASFRHYRHADYWLSYAISNAVLQGTHVSGIVWYYDYDFNSIDNHLDSSEQATLTLQQKWDARKEELKKLFQGPESAGTVIIMPAKVPSDKTELAGTVQFQDIKVKIDTSMFESMQAFVSLNILNSMGVIEPRMFGMQLGKFGVSSNADQKKLLDEAFELTALFMNPYVEAIETFFEQLAVIEGLAHKDANDNVWRIRTKVDLSKKSFSLFSNEMINLYKLAGAHPNEIRGMLGWELKDNEELTNAFNFQLQASGKAVVKEEVGE